MIKKLLYPQLIQQYILITIFIKSFQRIQIVFIDPITLSFYTHILLVYMTFNYTPLTH